MKHYVAVSVQSRHTEHSVRCYVIGWKNLLDCSTLAVCRTQAMAEAMREVLMDGIPQEQLWYGGSTEVLSVIALPHK